MEGCRVMSQVLRGRCATIGTAANATTGVVSSAARGSRLDRTPNPAPRGRETSGPGHESCPGGSTPPAR
eukprot:5555250-Alexandrium_andersonii.AAC.1